ncbi:MAG TPA: ABC transporter permease [Pyrinomonadaceae bacterium]|jgi:putative ABC transport system permease protein
MLVLVRVAPSDIPRMDEVYISVPALLFTALVTLLTTFLFGLVPALIVSRTSLNESLREGGVKVSGERRGNRLRQGLIIAEVAVTVVLLVGAGLLFRSFVLLRQDRLGFDPQNVLTMQLSLNGAKYAQPDKRREFYALLLEQLRAQPGVSAAGAVLIRPLEGPIGWDMPYMTEGQSADDAKRNPVPNYEVVTPQYFRAMGIPLLAGRDFTEQDGAEAPQVVVVSRAMARRVFPAGVDPLGRRLKLDPSDPEEPWRTVVGVAGDARYRSLGDQRPDIYVPYRQSNAPSRYLAIRTTGDPEAMAPVVRRVLAGLDAEQALTGVMTGEQLVARAIGRPRFNMLLLNALALVGVTLALIGIYGVVSYMFTQRTREIGIRIALGAQTRDVLKLIVAQGMRLVLLGIGAGLVVALAFAVAFAGPIAGLLYNTSTTDPLIFVGVALLLAVVALLACLVPTRRVAKLDPVAVLHYE